MKVLINRISFFQIIDHWQWLFLFLTAPLLMFPTLRTLPVLLVVPILWVVSWGVNGHKKILPPSIFSPVLLLIAVMVLVSLWATYDISVSLSKIAGMVLAFGVFYATAREGSTWRGWQITLLVLLVSGAAVAGLGLLGTNWFHGKIMIFDAITGHLSTRITGWMGASDGFQPNQVAGTLLWVLPLMITLMLGTWRKARYWSIGLGLVTMGCLFVLILTQSRGAYLAFFAVLLIGIWLILPRRIRVILAIVLLVIVMIGSVVLTQLGMDGLLRFFGYTVIDDPAFSLNTLVGRAEIWQRGLYGIRDFPVTGMGMNTFRYEFNVLYPLNTISPTYNLGHAHNELIQAALDLGLPGLVAFVGLYILAFWQLLVLWFKNTWPVRAHGPLALVSPRWVSAGLGLSLLGHFLYGMTDAVALGAKPGFIFWMLLGLITALYQQVCSGVIINPSEMQGGKTSADI